MGEPLIKINRNKFEIENDKIATYPNLQIKIVFYVFAILMLAMVIGSIYVGIKYDSIGRTMPIILINAAMIVLLIVAGSFLSSKKVVFDKVTQEVYSVNGPFKKHLIKFQDIHDINKSSNALSGLYYRIQPKYDLVGNGIRISVPYSNTISKQEREFTTDVLPKLKEMVFNTKTNNTISNPAVSNTINKTAFVSNTTFENFKTNDNNTFTYAPIIKNVYFIVAAGSFLFLAKYLSIFIKESIAEHKIEYGALLGMVMFMGASVYFMYRNSQRIIIDKSAQTIIQSNFFGLIKYDYSFHDFEKYLNIKNYTNGIYTGTDIKIIFKNNVSVKIDNKYNTQKIQNIIDELNAIIFNN